MDITTLENWLWEAACSVRGELDAPGRVQWRVLDVADDSVRRDGGIDLVIDPPSES